jgi:hypothetical protein
MGEPAAGQGGGGAFMAEVDALALLDSIACGPVSEVEARLDSQTVCNTQATAHIVICKGIRKFALTAKGTNPDPHSHGY